MCLATICLVFLLGVLQDQHVLATKSISGVYHHGHKRPSSSPCRLSVRFQNEFCPLYVDERSHLMLMPNKERVIEIQHQQTFLVGCSGDKNGLQGARIATDKELKIKCQNGVLHVISTQRSQQTISENALTNKVCSKKNRAEYESVRRNDANKGYRMFFKLTESNSEVEFMDGILDSMKLNSLMTHITQVPSIKFVDPSSVSHTIFSAPALPSSIGTYPYKVMALYQERTSISDGDFSSPECRKAADKKGGNSARTLSRGHLTASRDFVYNFQREETYYYTNAAPQWQITNGGNFLLVEELVRTLVSKYKKPCEVYSGTHGTIKIKRDIGKGNNDIKDTHLEAPEVFWKVVYNKQSGSGLVFIVYNSPCPVNSALSGEFERLIEKRDQFCSNAICDEIWRHFNEHEAMPQDMVHHISHYNVKGKTLCCKNIARAVTFFDIDKGVNNPNELKLLPFEVQSSNRQLVLN